ncbi:MAG: hypothetical protein PHX56_03425 [Atribacterota bacterium]|nr:hypothetical protein [Atribacterota bacterium]
MNNSELQIIEEIGNKLREKQLLSATSINKLLDKLEKGLMNQEEWISIFDFERSENEKEHYENR